MWPACVQQRSVHVDYEWTIKSHALACYVCVFVRGCRMIHLAVILPAAVSSKLITMERERESISFTSLPRVLYESTNCLFDCLNKWHKANESEPSALHQMVWLLDLGTSINHSHSSHYLFSVRYLLHRDTVHFILYVMEIKMLSLLWGLIIFM